MDYTDSIKRSGKSVVIFGAGRGGWYVMKVLEHYGVPIEGFADNDPAKHGIYFNYPVHPPDHYADPGVEILSGILNNKNAPAIKAQLRALGFLNIFDAMDAFLFAYFIIVAKRKCDEEKLAYSIALLYDDTGAVDFSSPSLSYVITQKCTLRCEHCGAFVEHFKTPEHIPVETIVDDIKNYCRAFDVVHHIALQGGEPFLHPDIEKLCGQVAAIPNLIFVDFVTNGTIVPSKNTIHKFFECGDCVLISDYGTYSTKSRELSTVLYDKNVYFDYYRYDSSGWIQQSPIFPRNRSPEDNKKIFAECISHPRTCCQIMNGELHRCSFSNCGSHAGLLPRFENDFVKLNEPGLSNECLRARIGAFLNRDTAPDACDYCPSNEAKVVKAGVQLAKRRTG